jgi:hypothetical protein
MLNEVKHLYAPHSDFQRASGASLNMTMEHKVTLFTEY